MKKIHLFSYLCFITFACCHGEVVQFPVPTGIASSTDYEVFVNNEEVFCYGTWRHDNINTTATLNSFPLSPLSFSMFDFEGSIDIRLELAEGLLDNPQKLQIMPSSLGIIPVIAGNTVEFTLHEPANITIDPQGDGLNALHLFTNRPETDASEPGDPGVVYYGPGIHNVDHLSLASGSTLYLAGGAILRPLPMDGSGATANHYGYVYTNSYAGIRVSGDNVTIRGRGMISGLRSYEGLRTFTLLSAGSRKNLKIEDILLIDNLGWNSLYDKCDGVLIDNLKIIGYATSTDATMISGSANCVVKNSFAHNADDGFEIQAWASVSNIRYENCQIWSNGGGPLGITSRGVGDISDVVYANITVLHYTPAPYDSGYNSRGIMNVHPAGGGSVNNIRFENIVIENSTGGRPMFHVGNEQLSWNGTPFYDGYPFCSISNVTFHNITARNVLNTEFYFFDASESNLVSGVVMSDVVINGMLVDSFSDVNLIGGDALSCNFAYPVNIQKFIGVPGDLSWEEITIASGSTLNVDGSTMDVSTVAPTLAESTVEWEGWSNRKGLRSNSGEDVTVTLSDIPYANYRIFAYIGGYGADFKASLSDGATTKYIDFMSLPVKPSLIESSDTNSADGYDAGSYITFGSESSPLTNESSTLTLTQSSGVPALGGLQVVNVDPLHPSIFLVEVSETNPPTPDPAMFAVAPAAVAHTAIIMTATTGSDVSGPVEYLFTETSGNPGGSSSSWQTSASYMDTGLNPSTLYTYTVTMRDSLANMGTPSIPASATTLAAAPIVIWDGGGADLRWDTPENWDADQLPAFSDTRIRGDYNVEVDSAVVTTVSRLYVGTDAGTTSTVTMTGGIVTSQDSWVTLGAYNDTHGVVNLSGGTIAVPSAMLVGNAGSGTVNMTGGLIDTYTVSVGHNSHGADDTGHIQLDGGTIDAVTLKFPVNGTMDITGGTLLLWGDKTSEMTITLPGIADLVAAGVITAYGGSGEVVYDYDLSNPGRTTVTAVPITLDACSLDLNNDGDVNLYEFSILASDWSRGIPGQGDFTGDGTVDMDDLEALVNFWLCSCSL